MLPETIAGIDKRNKRHESGHKQVISMQLCTTRRQAELADLRAQVEQLRSAVHLQNGVPAYEVHLHKEPSEVDAAVKKAPVQKAPPALTFFRARACAHA